MVLSRITVAKALKKLEYNGIIERRICKDNKRKNELFLTSNEKNIFRT